MLKENYNMVDIVLKLNSPEVTVDSTPVTISNSVIFRVYAPSTAKITIWQGSTNVEQGSMTIPGGFVEIITKGTTDTVSAVPSVLCTPVSWR